MVPHGLLAPHDAQLVRRGVQRDGLGFGEAGTAAEIGGLLEGFGVPALRARAAVPQPGQVELPTVDVDDLGVLFYYCLPWHAAASVTLRKTITVIGVSPKMVMPVRDSASRGGAPSAWPISGVLAR